MRTANVVLVPAGGDFSVGAFAVFTVSLPCKTAPTWKTSRRRCLDGRRHPRAEPATA